MRRIPAQPAGARDRAIVAAQLGRDPRGGIAVAGRCEYGLPAAIRTSPHLDDGTPFPTLYYLVCPMAVRAVGALEASGTMRGYEARLSDDPALRDAYARAHERYLAQRDSIDRLEDRSSAGGMPDRVKCLHALYAHELADSNPVGAMVRAEVEPLGCPGPCVEETLPGVFGRVPGHPGTRRKRRQ